jgi:hypothetical protein
VAAAVFVSGVIGSGLAAVAQQPAAQPAAAAAPAATSAPAAATPAAIMEKRAAHYVEGPGYITFFHKQTPGYGGTYGECEKNCLADSRCVMIEFYKPLRKCHLYNHTKFSGQSRDADVALKRAKP